MRISPANRGVEDHAEQQRALEVEDLGESALAIELVLLRGDVFLIRAGAQLLADHSTTRHRA